MPIDLATVSCTPATKSAAETLVYNDIYRGKGGSDMDPDQFSEKDQVYLVSNTSISLGDGLEITAIGWVDGYLHIQERRTKNLETTSAGFWLVNDREERYGSISVMWSPKKGCICEEIFIPMKPEELGKYRLHGYAISGGTEIEGNWKVKFKLKETG